MWKNSSSVRVLLSEELDVVDQQHVGVAVGVLEGRQRFGAERGDEVVRERLGGRVADGGAAAEREHVVADRVQQVRLAEPGRRVEEERVVGLSGELGDRKRGAMREAVSGADDELVEAVAGVERAAVAARPTAGAAVGVWARLARAAVVQSDPGVGAEDSLCAQFERAPEAV